jgi:myo-inositol-1(or 4)-monophosphatase
MAPTRRHARLTPPPRPTQSHAEVRWGRLGDVTTSSVESADVIDEGALLQLALGLAAQAAVLVRDGRRDALSDIDTKSSPTDMVTAMDRASERLIVDGIGAVRPDDGFIGEEGTTTAGATGVQWLIDPIDGTTNYVYDFPGAAVSIAARIDGVLAVGVVVDLALDCTYTARRGHGAHCNGEVIRVRPSPPLDQALVATGFGFRAERRAAQAELLLHVLPAVRDIRRRGSCALDLCMLAAGQVDAYYERGLGPWDFAAGALIAREAGATVGDLDGNDPDGTFLVATSSDGLWSSLRTLLDQHGARAIP